MASGERELELELENATLKKELARIQEKIENADAYNTDLEQKYNTSERHFDIWIEATKVQKEKLDKANEDVLEKDKIIMALEKQVGEDSKSIKEKQAALDRHQQLLDQARVAEKKAIQRADGLEAQLESAIKDSKGLLARCSDLEQSGHMSAKELSALRVQAKIYEDAADDIKYERDRYKILSKEYQRLKEDFDKLGFRPDPDENRKKAHAPPRRSLGDELAEVGSSSESENEGDSAPRRPGHLGIPPVMPKEIERIVTQTVTKNVYIDRTKIVDRPFQVAAHHPILCWFQVELNFLILLFAFVSALTPIVARFASRVLGDPAVEVSASATTSSPITEQAGPSNGTQRPPTSSIECRPVASDPQTSTAQSTDEQPPPEADLEHIRPRVWDWSTITNPKTMPQARPTIIGFACHLIVYSLLLFVYGAYAERQLWLAANDSTRIYVRQLLDRPESFRSGMSKILFMLPDGWKHTIDRLMFKAVVLGLNLKVNHPMPG